MQSKTGIFNGEIVAGSLLEKESRVIARLMLENLDEETRTAPPAGARFNFTFFEGAGGIEACEAHVHPHRGRARYGARAETDGPLAQPHIKNGTRLPTVQNAIRIRITQRSTARRQPRTGRQSRLRNYLA